MTTPIADALTMKRKLTLYRAVIALSRGTIEWWHCPRTNRPVLKTRCGNIYNVSWLPRGGGGWMLTRLKEWV